MNIYEGRDFNGVRRCDYCMLSASMATYVSSRPLHSGWRSSGNSKRLSMESSTLDLDSAHQPLDQLTLVDGQPHPHRTCQILSSVAHSSNCSSKDLISVSNRTAASS